MRIDGQLIDYLAELSRLELAEGEKAALAHDLEDILAYVAKLDELDTSGAREMTHPFDVTNKFREDVVANADRTDELLAGAPERKGPYFRVPRTVEE